jgi:hypothetical protein
MVAEETAAFAKRLTVLEIAPPDRAVVLDLLRQTCEALASVTTNVANDVVEETPAGGALGTPDGWMPTAGRLVMELSHMGDYLCAARDTAKDAVEAVEDITTEQATPVGAELDTVDGTVIDGRQALIDSGDLPGPDGAYLSTTQRTALAQFRVKWAAQNGVTR